MSLELGKVPMVSLSKGTNDWNTISKFFNSLLQNRISPSKTLPFRFDFKF